MFVFSVLHLCIVSAFINGKFSAYNPTIMQSHNLRSISPPETGSPLYYIQVIQISKKHYASKTGRYTSVDDAAVHNKRHVVVVISGKSDRAE
jgi:hypothetical protein